jgi:tetratricopeptide (TPR) repeat protein
MTGFESDISKRVELYLSREDEDDEVEGESWEELVALLDEAIKASPDAALFGLRARMNSAAYDHYSAMCDWEQAVALDPAGREATLTLAGLRLRSPDRLAESAIRHEKYVAQGSPAPCDDEEEEDGEDDWDDADQERAVALAEHYAADATRSLLRLVDEHGADLDFVHSMFDAFDEFYNLDTWVHYTMLLKVLAAHPDDMALRAREARYLTGLANHCAIDSEEIPAGYWESVSGQRLHVVTLERAVRCIDEVCALAPDPALLVSKADMLSAIEHYPAAAAVYRQAAALFDSAAASAADDVREELSDKAGDARTQAELCLQGRQAINNANFASIETAMQGLQDMRAEWRLEAGREAPEDDYGMADKLAELRGALEESEPTMTDEQRDQYHRLAESLARQTVGMISLDAVELGPIDGADLEGGLLPWFDSIRPELERSGLTLGQQFDNPSNNRMLRTQCQGQWWTDASGASALVVEGARSLTFTLRRLLTELSDQSFIMTADDRCRSFWQYGPTIDALSVDGTTPLATMIALHQVRVARALAARPDLHANPIDSLARLAEAENRARVAKLDFRKKEKITEIEVRGMHVQFHDEFKAMLEAAITQKHGELDQRSST